MSAASSPRSDTWTLEDYFHHAGLQDRPAWSSEVVLENPPFPHQVQALAHNARFIRRSDFSEPGVGKTYGAQAYLIWSCAQGNRAIVLVPPILIPQFVKEFKKFRGLDRYMKVSSFVGDLRRRTDLIQTWDQAGWPAILVMSYRMFVGAKEVTVYNRHRAAAERAARNGKEPKKMLSKDECPATYWNWSDFVSRGYTDLVVDEATAVKHATSSLYRAVRGFVGPYTPEESNGLLLMTGTPIENVLEDAYGLISLVDPTRYKSRRAFDKFHCVRAQATGKVIRYQHLEYLSQGLFEAGRRVLKKDVLKDLPPMMLSEVQVDLHSEHQKLYRKLVNERLLELGDKVIDATTSASLRQKVQQIILTPEHFSEEPWKKNALVEALDQVVEMVDPKARKVLVFAYFQRSIEKLQAHYAEYNPAVLYGKTGSREEQITKFKTDPSCRMLIAQVRSSGYGLNFQDVCSHVILVEMVAIPGLLQQAFDRVHRAQQTESVTAYLMVVNKTVSVSIRNDLARKSGDAGDVTRDKRATLRDLLGADGIQGKLE